MNECMGSTNHTCLGTQPTNTDIGHLYVKADFHDKKLTLLRLPPHVSDTHTHTHTHAFIGSDNELIPVGTRADRGKRATRSQPMSALARSRTRSAHADACPFHTHGSRVHTGVIERSSQLAHLVWSTLIYSRRDYVR